MREAKDRRALSLEHRTWHLESRQIQGQARAQRLDECLPQRPEPIERRRLGLSGHPRQDAPFPGAVHSISDAVEVPAGGARLHVHLESGPGPGRESDRAVLAAVAHVEVRVRGDPAHPSERLAVLKLTERRVLVRAPPPFAEVDAECRAARRELTLGDLDPEPAPACPLVRVEKGENPLFGGRMGPEVDVQDEQTRTLPVGTPPDRGAEPVSDRGLPGGQQDLAQIGAHSPSAVPLPGMSERGLLERCAVEPVDPRMWRWP